jgi:hypothetical protein
METINDTQKEMIEQFQCSGCVCGSNVSCGKFQFKTHSAGDFYCSNQVAGTTLMPGGKIYLGMPKGFNKVGDISNDYNNKRTTNIRLYEEFKQPYDFLNVPVWALEQDGYLFIRVFSPRVNISNIDVIKNGILWDICPKAIDMSDKLEEID